MQAGPAEVMLAVFGYACRNALLIVMFGAVVAAILIWWVQ